MGLPIPEIKFLFKIFKKYNIKGKALTFGNQDVYLDKSKLANLINLYKFGNNNFNKKLLTSSKELKQYKHSENFIHASVLFETLNIKTENYFDIDKFEFDNPRIIHDLQLEVPQKYHNHFDFILDAGTLEHIFDVKSVLKNIMLLTKINGYVLHIVPCHNYVNHGFYTFSPTFFYDFYEINGFEIIESYFTEIKSNKKRFYKYDHIENLNNIFINRNKRYLNFVLVKKTSQNDSLKIPNQSFYENLNNLKKKDIDQGVNQLKRIIPFYLHPYFYGIWYSLKKFMTKYEYFDLSNSSTRED